MPLLPCNRQLGEALGPLPPQVACLRPPPSAYLFLHLKAATCSLSASPEVNFPDCQYILALPTLPSFSIPFLPPSWTWHSPVVFAPSNQGLLRLEAVLASFTHFLIYRVPQIDPFEKTVI